MSSSYTGARKLYNFFFENWKEIHLTLCKKKKKKADNLQVCLLHAIEEWFELALQKPSVVFDLFFFFFSWLPEENNSTYNSVLVSVRIYFMQSAEGDILELRLQEIWLEVWTTTMLFKIWYWRWFLKKQEFNLQTFNNIKSKLRSMIFSPISTHPPRS